MKQYGFREMSPISYVFYSILHPKDGFQEMKYNKKTSKWIVICILVLWTFVELSYRAFTDYDLNLYSNQDQNLFRVAIITILMFVMAITANWCFCTLLDGKGRLLDIAVVGSYSLVPFIIVRFLSMLISFVTTQDMQVFISYATLVTELWCFFMIFTGLEVIHEYTGKKTFLSLVLTVIGLLIILFLGFLAVSLYQQLYSFVNTLLLEIRYR